MAHILHRRQLSQFQIRPAPRWDVANLACSTGVWWWFSSYCLSLRRQRDWDGVRMVRCGGGEEVEEEADRPAEVGGQVREYRKTGEREQQERSVWVRRLSQTMNPDCGDASDIDRFCLNCEVTDSISSLLMSRSQAGPSHKKRNRNAQIRPRKEIRDNKCPAAWQNNINSCHYHLVSILPSFH